MAQIGTDIVQVNRVDLTNENLIKRILHDDEFVYLEQIQDIEAKKQFVAGRWAAKEAIFKATNKNIAPNKISIGYLNNKPVILNEELKSIVISISHEKEYAIAVALYL
ncbi:holo-ACP synthase [Spiroplasma tabanidicola]|uniref:Holo-[acyl-carrier-protein] synthase n=1 Tax=Spiroplasma tabanidicola TaxID=324079 RepID=A0A6I6CCW0_9MOLU|nr:4'-phosphopantetheinyl transferase superfamily protein [Spiroplasma tabanidicola]QGS52128.1 holo-[acyl-carrier-protein] synthase [Spiroplasma tabanidicola]